MNIKRLGNTLLYVFPRGALSNKDIDDFKVLCTGVHLIR